MTFLASLALVALPQVVVLDEGWELAPESEAATRPAPDAWRPAAVPGTFEADLGPDFDGVAWYRRTVERAAGDPGERWRVEFRAAATAATVYWNGVEVGSHLGGWTPFEVELPAPADRELPGLLEVRVDERVGHDTQGFLTIIQPHFGGLWQGVRLQVDSGPTLDGHRSKTFGDLARERLAWSVTVRRREADPPLDVVVRVRDGPTCVARTRAEIQGESATGELLVPDLRAWAPGRPELYDVELELVWRGTDEPLDTLARRVGFRNVDRDGTTLLWNGQPLQVRGMLHWGFSPPDFAPSPDPARWRRDLELLRDLGCNLVKCCLWVPPTSYYEVADELGILVWQEYPTWHAQLLEEHLPALEREFRAFYQHDRNHTAVAFRSLTCESGADVDESVLRALYDVGHAEVPNSLIIDNSSWIAWMRVHDFWDDHPYGNNGWWPGKLAEIEQFVSEREAQPILFGECIASDTWFDREAWEAAHGDERRWYEPWCLDAQAEFEHELRVRWGDEFVCSLLPVSRRYALRNRKYQCERLRLDLPDAGYVLSVIRDFPKARMGFLDDLDRPKWSSDEWAWHGDTMLCLDTEDDRRGFVSNELARVPVRLAHFGPSKLTADVHFGLSQRAGPENRALGDLVPASTVSAEPGQVLSLADPFVVPMVSSPNRVRARVQLTSVTDAAPVARNEWDLWYLPQIESVDEAAAIRIVDTLSAEVLSALEAGARVLLRAHPGSGSFKTSGLWFLQGAPWAPPHPLNERVPRELLYDLQGFDLEQAFVLHGEHLFEQVDPILGFWDTHDSHGVNRWLLAFETRVGAGRLLVSALDHETPAGQWVESEFVRHLATGPAPERALTEETVDALRATLAGETVELATWRFRTDPDDVGRARGWHAGLDTRDGWRDMPAGRHWESEGVSYDGVAWYALELDVPASWRGQRVHAVFDGVDDSYHLYCNGQLVARHGDPETGETVWLVRTTGELTDALEYGAANRIVLRVVDHTGAGGLHRKARVTTGWTGELGAELLN